MTFIKFKFNYFQSPIIFFFFVSPSKKSFPSFTLSKIFLFGLSFRTSSSPWDAVYCLRDTNRIRWQTYEKDYSVRLLFTPLVRRHRYMHMAHMTARSFGGSFIWHEINNIKLSKKFTKFKATRSNDDINNKIPENNRFASIWAQCHLDESERGRERRVASVKRQRVMNWKKTHTHNTVVSSSSISLDNDRDR